MSTFTNPLTEFSPQLEALELPPASGYEYEAGDGVFSEDEEMELAAALLETTHEQEIDQFLGDLIRKAGRAIGKIVKSPAGSAIGGVLKSVIGKTLPIAGGVFGGLAGGPLGAQLGNLLASTAGTALGLELEGLSPEDREFEATKRFIRFAGEVVRIAHQGPPGTDPSAAAHEAAMEAARVHAPGLLIGAPGFNADKRLGENTMHDTDRTQVGSAYEFEGGPYPSGEAAFTANEEMELAADLMELNSEEEFENFLGDLISRAAKAVGGYINSKTGESLGGLLKGAARQILPIVDQALGGPGGKSAEMEMEYGGSNLFESEMEESEWEAANTFVRLAQEAAVNAAQAPAGADPAVVADKAVTDAAKTHAPDLVAPRPAPMARPMPRPFGGFAPGMGRRPRARYGRWMRRGNSIVLFGV